MIYVFKTSVRNQKHIRQLSPFLNNLLQGAKWNFDLADCDHILRIDSEENMVQPVISLLADYRFSCEELE